MLLPLNVIFFSNEVTISCFNFQNLSIAIVGKGQNFTIYEDDAVSTYLELIAGEQPAPAAPGD